MRCAPTPEAAATPSRCGLDPRTAAMRRGCVLQQPWPHATVAAAARRYCGLSLALPWPRAVRRCGLAPAPPRNCSRCHASPLPCAAAATLAACRPSPPWPCIAAGVVPCASIVSWPLRERDKELRERVREIRERWGEARGRSGQRDTKGVGPAILAILLQPMAFPASKTLKS